MCSRSEDGRSGSTNYCFAWIVPLTHFQIFMTLDLPKTRLDRDLAKNGHFARIFNDTGANINTITKDIYNLLVSQGLKSKFTIGPKYGIEVKLVGAQSLTVSGDKARFKVDVMTNMGYIGSEHKFGFWIMMESP